MKTSKNLGIWMDHSSAHIMEFTSDPIETKTLESQGEEQGVGKNEHTTHNAEQHNQSAYYKKLGAVIKNYDSVILFGPTNAKSELLNILRADHLFEKIKIEVLLTDKLTEPQQHAFVREHFSKH